MKYYINLIKRRKIKPILVMLGFDVLGVWCFVSNLMDLLQNGYRWGIYDTVDFSFSNFDLVIVGPIVMWSGFIFLPVTSCYSQNEEEWNVMINSGYIDICFRDYEFHLPVEKFTPRKLMWRDKNRKFVGVTRAYQVYNYVTLVAKAELPEKPKNKRRRKRELR